MSAIKRDFGATMRSPGEFYAVARNAQIGDALPVALFIMDAPNGTPLLWHVIGRAHPGKEEVGLLLANYQHELAPRTPPDAPLTIAVVASSQLVLRTKGPYQVQHFPDLLDVCYRLKEPSSPIVACICPFTVTMRCKGCGTSMMVLSYPPEQFNEQYCVLCRQRKKRGKKR